MEKEWIKENIKVKNQIYTWKNNWNKTDQIERIVYNEKVLANMKKKKIKDLRKEVKKINLSLSEEKQRYSTENKEKIKKNSIELYNFFLSEEKQMLQSYETKTKEKEN